MTCHIYAVRQPDGRCVLLAHKLYHTTSLTAKESVRLAEMLYVFSIRADNPTMIEVMDMSQVLDLQNMCSPMGVVVEPIEDRTGKGDKKP